MAGEAGDQRAGRPPGMPAPLAGNDIVAGLEGTGGPAPFWSLVSLTQLQVKEADCWACFLSLQGPPDLQ